VLLLLRAVMAYVQGSGGCACSNNHARVATTA